MKFSVRQRLKSFVYAFKGIRTFIDSTQNAWIQISIAALTVAAGIYFRINRTEWIDIVICIGIVLACEAVNTSIERLCDKLHPAKDGGIGIVKDLSAGAVLIAAVFTAIVGCIIFIPKIIGLFSAG